jgi:DNA polymerase-3 subunit beta
LHTKPKENVLIVVGTDGHRLALLKKKLDAQMKEEKQIIVPRKAVSELRKFLPATKKSEEAEGTNVQILIGEKHLLFTVNGVQFLTRLIEGTYPNYENVIPQDNKKKMIIERDSFSKVLRRVSVMSRERASAVRCDLGQDTLVVSSSNPDLGEAKEELAVDYKDDKLSLGFNARYIIDALGAMMSEKVTFELQDPLSPVLMKEEGNEDYKCVIMPMRI